MYHQPMKFFRGWWPYLVVSLFWLLDTVSKWKYNGLIYGLDYGLYHPDGSLYTFRTLNWLGHSELDSGTLVSNWYRDHAYKFTNIDPTSLFYKIHPQWDRYLPRIIYPLFSMPFVALFGIKGMLVVPALSMLILMLVVVKVGKSVGQVNLGVVVAILFSFSLTVNRWMFINTTDSLLVGFFSLMLLLIVSKKSGWVWWAPVALIIVLSSFTRVALLGWLGIGLVYFFNKQRARGIYISIISLLSFIPSVLGNTSSAILPNEAEGPLGQKLLAYPKTFIKVGFYEVAQLAVLDRLLLALLLIGLFFAIVNWRKLSSQFYIVELLALWLTGAVNGTVGVNFRYQLTLLPFLGWILVDNWTSSKSFLLKKSSVN